MRRLITIAGIGIMAGVVAFLVGRTSGTTTVEAQDIRTAPVERLTLGETVETSGTIAPERTIYLSFSTSGIAREVLVEVGDSVEAGEVLARLDTRALEYQVALKEQALIVQQTSLDQLIAPPTAQQIAQAQANLASAQANLTSAQANLNAAPNQTTINCSNLTTLQTTLNQAQDDYDAYVRSGYQWDATFIPDLNSPAGTALRSAQQSYDVALAQCNNTTSRTQYELQVASAQASVNQAQAALDALMQGATAEEIAAQQARVAQAQLELDNARSSLNDAVIAAPFAGVISGVNFVVGELVNNGATAITLVDTSKLHVDVDVDELDIAKVTLGQTALISADALGNTPVEGTVARIAPTGTNTNGVVTYKVRVNLNDDGSIPVRVGMTTDVEIAISGAENALVVPTEAIQRDGAREYVEVWENGAATRVNVTSGRTSEGYTAVSGDLTVGMEVVIPQRTTQTAGAPGAFAAPIGGP